MSKGPIVAPTVSDNKLDLIKGLMNLLKEAGLVASSFDANELFDLDLKVIPSSVKTVIIELKPWWVRSRHINIRRFQIRYPRPRSGRQGVRLLCPTSQQLFLDRTDRPSRNASHGVCPELGCLNRDRINYDKCGRDQDHGSQDQHLRIGPSVPPDRRNRPADLSLTFRPR
ncbi:hypothetical protein PF006_g26342 [Phytophthora fragariae]|uniref:Uncharacterized protein n=1 Tax=Phytophthora fragariae TaxID=53985 RepID=A0A6A3QX41_9STRA|nr:hypothetical protein PF006_g26342 [Phytophthora fragariae]